MKFKNFFALFFSFFLFSCGKSQNSLEVYSDKSYIMSVPLDIKVYSPDMVLNKAISQKIIAEAKRISDEFSYNEQYSLTSYLNKNAYDKWVSVDTEMLNLLLISKKYYEMTAGGFDITFAPLWPIWKEAASKRKLPSDEEIKKAILKMGFDAIEIDVESKKVKFNKPIEINLGGILRGYAFVKILRLIKKENFSARIEVSIGANKLCMGEGDWEYPVASPFDEKKILGVLKFPSGVVVSSSGRSHFVEIEGKLYSHILNVKTGYPIENFSNLIIYMPEITGDFISSAALAISGKEKTFDLVSKTNGACALWIDGSGNETYFSAPDSLCKWEKPKKYLFF